MFKINELNKIAKFSLLTEDLLKPFWNLASDIMSVEELLKEFASDVFKKARDYNFISDKEEDLEKVNDALTSGFNYYIKGLTRGLLAKGSLNAIAKNSSILFTFQDPSTADYYFIEESSSTKKSGSESLKKYIIGKKIIANFLKSTKNDDMENLASIESPILYSKVVEESDSLIIEMPVIPVDYLDLSDEALEFGEVEYWWTNYYRLKEYYPDFPKEPKKIRTFSSDNHALGIIVDGYCFLTRPLLQDRDASKYLRGNKTFDYIWLCFKHKVLYEASHKENQQRTEGSEGISKFLKVCKKDDFVNAISCLRDNLYIDKPEIPEVCNEFFDRMLKIYDLKDFETYKFFIDKPKDEGATVFGLYQNVKIDKDYHLKYLVESKRGELHDKIIPSIKNEAVWVLKPKIAQFFLRDFFERLLFSALNDLKREKQIEDCESNYFAELSNGGSCEIDAIVKTNSSLWFIEAKTTLTVKLISDYVKKCRKIVSDFNEIDNNLRFMIVGYFSNPELEIFKNAIQPGKEMPNGYNKSRDGLQNTPYYFEVPVDGNPAHNLVCFTEPSYNKLKDTLSQTFER